MCFQLGLMAEFHPSLHILFSFSTRLRFIFECKIDLIMSIVRADGLPLCICWSYFFFKERRRFFCARETKRASYNQCNLAKVSFNCELVYRRITTSVDCEHECCMRCLVKSHQLTLLMSSRAQFNWSNMLHMIMYMLTHRQL